MSSENKRWDTDDIISDLGMGKYQWISMMLIGFAQMYASIAALNFVFTTLDIPLRCKIPECEMQELTSTEEWLYYAVPHENENTEKCFRFPLKEEFLRNISGTFRCSSEMFQRDKIHQETCIEHVYYDKRSSIISDLACDAKSIALVGTLHSTGHFIGIPLSGVISDLYGRKTAMVYGCVLSAIFGILRSFSPTYRLFLVSELLESILNGGVYACSFIFAVELVPTRSRPIVGTFLGTFYSFGGIIFAAIAWTLKDWRLLLRITYAPGLLIISYFWLMDESVRWLRAKGRESEALDAIEKISKINKKSLWKDTSSLELNALEKETQNEKKHNVPLFAALSSKTVLVQVAVCSYCWVTMTLVYYGLSIQSVSLAGNKYINFMFSSVLDLISGYGILPILKYCKRRHSLSLTYILTGISCLSFQCVPYNWLWLQRILYGVSKLMIAFAGWIIYVYAAEIFPTELRNSLMGLCSTVGRIGSMLAPQSIILAAYFGSYVPILLFGVVSFLAGFLVLLLPETKDQKLPEGLKNN